MRLLTEHEFWTYVERDQSFYHFPIHKSDVDRMPDREIVIQELERKNEPDKATNLEDYWLRSVGGTLYSKFVETYSKKMWGVSSNRELDDFSWSPKGVALNTRDSPAAWTEAISAFPVAADGYDQFFLKSTQDVEVHLNTTIQAFDLEKKRIKVDDKWLKYDVIVNTLAPDTVFNGVFGPLRWVGRDFMQIVLPVEALFPKDVYFLYYANSEPFTRIVEYKKFYNNYSSPTTLLGLEIPSTNGKLYPMPTKVDQARADRYFSILPDGVFSIGRAGSYRYDVDIDDIIEQSLNIGESV
jgi:UDP-galactopyranose mutase